MVRSRILYNWKLAWSSSEDVKGCFEAWISYSWRKPLQETWIVEDRIPNGYFDGSLKQKLDSASWLVAGSLTSSLQKEISADCKEVTKASG
ncbi:hypothetical protein PIB30_015810 [Stylosanthes scabra]|uniref:Uncharacterized protein n=1 Tax=Stylosanthes scabra TaxID=79078 RepID=A0ABU6Q7W4_9FABA|nr:hypothetical protein [Stylosanthes scabra]